MAKRSTLRPSALEIATDLTLAAREEPVDVLLEPPELVDDIKSKWDRLIA